MDTQHLLPPPSLSTAARACAAHWRTVSVANTAATSTPTRSSHGAPIPRGFPCWLDPLIYLRRPTPQFEAPHIDETGGFKFHKIVTTEIDLSIMIILKCFSGARIFTLPEINSMCALGHIPQDAIEVPIDEENTTQQYSPQRSPTRFSVKSFEGESEGAVMPSSKQNDQPILEETRQVAPASVLRQLRVRWFKLDLSIPKKYKFEGMIEYRRDGTKVVCV